MINPAWQNYSSMFREVVAAKEARTAMERAHHLTAGLYFGIAALEAFLNGKMRETLSEKGQGEEEIIGVLRKSQIMAKLKRWPGDLLTSPFTVSSTALDQLGLFNDIRGNLTHPKTDGHDLYARLEAVDPDDLVNVTAEYIARFYEAEGTRFPYWLFGWNYLNPRPDSYEIILVGDQQFSYSLQNLGFRVPAAEWGASEAWRNRFLGTYAGYVELRDCLQAISHCEAKQSMFPFQPKLCRRWWSADHQAACGNVTDDALKLARTIGS